MNFDISKIAVHQAYNLLIGLVAPRPIAWITTLDLQGRVNAAPFSAYNYVGTDPPIVGIGVINSEDDGDSLMGHDGSIYAGRVGGVENDGRLVGVDGAERAMFQPFCGADQNRSDGDSVGWRPTERPTDTGRSEATGVDRPS